MDVDLLRPGNVPISPNTVLWFEFLLKPDLLEEHLNKPNPDPVPIDLLVKFLTLSVEPPSEESFEKTKNFKCSKRHLSMKILALKIVAFWKWDLEMIESKLPLQLQYVLFRDLLCLTADDPDINLFTPMMHHNLDFEHLKDEQIFAVSLYHRWSLRIIINSPMVPKNILCSTTANVESADEIMSRIMDDEGKSEIILQKIVNLRKDNIIIPTYHNIIPPTEKVDPKQHWENGLNIPVHKFFCQIYFDLGLYKLYREMTREAAEYFVICKNLYSQQDNRKLCAKSEGFCNIDETNLIGLCQACCVTVDKDQSLILQFYSAIHDNYSNIVNVLQIDNLKREIPLTYRDALELDLASSLANGKFTATRDLVFQIQTLNTIRRLFEGVPYPSVLDYITKLSVFPKGSAILTKSLKSILSSITRVEKQNVRLFLLILLNKCDSSLVHSITSDIELSSLFSKQELHDIRTRFDSGFINLPDLSVLEHEREKQLGEIGNAQLDLRMLERHIVNTYDPYKLKELIGRFSLLGARPLMKVCNKWKVPPITCQCMNTLPNQFLREYCYIVFAKIKELLKLKNYETARQLISVALDEVKKHKFSQMLMWETLYVNMVELLASWPAEQINRNSLAVSCKDCLLKSSQGSELQFSPRHEIRDLSITTLLNIRRDFLNSCSQKCLFPYLELSIALSAVCADVEKFKGNRKFTKEAWDLVMPAFYANNNQPRRQLNVDKDITKSNLTLFFLELRDPCVIDVTLSLLSKIQNVVRDEPQLELHFMYTQSWPPTVTNSNAYNPELVLEVIADVLKKVLTYQPQNRHWLKLLGDVNFVKGHHSTALKYYLEAIVASSDHFQQLPVPKNIIEDYVYKRMIKCCIFLQCYTQAAILCQFLDDVDYTTAFKCLTETASADATDCYYDYIWDVNILEYLIALHTKRNEHTKKQKVVEVVGLLELNSNNNEEIKLEASKLRKSKFLRALAKQYIYHLTL